MGTLKKTDARYVRWGTPKRFKKEFRSRWLRRTAKAKVGAGDEG